ncbi:NADH-quinone oxidoreductase subunit M [Mucilaginibacter frigoritolerans]|uniref:NADH-quinone oxidoreductase subunit M n=1 Tax=Mucilaginibacter frigoritolerans TaxID=652788 RepID=A0A562U2H1_9SPHI|nr:NADH-quinone oxidoreductase subunit M [Mucilaginibacter frigoritolerans]TWI99923.1 NADH-quinone oxidoreductase subunit M [Mucilaginibacter frigoritolerans]
MTVSILIFLPVISALAVLLFKNGATKHAALAFSVAELALAAIFLSRFVPDASIQFAVVAPWIPKLGIYFSAGIDGISMIMILLTNVLVPLIILTTYKHEYKNANAFYALILFMQAGMLVVFTALDGFLFYVGWEAALIPIYFICSLWGGVNRIKVTIKFFIYTFSGSLFMLVGIIYLYLLSPSKTFDLSAFTTTGVVDAHHQAWVFWAFFLAFAIKMPLFPFHTWQPDTYTEAPAAGTMMLSGIMLKMGIYGVIRWLIPIAPLGFQKYEGIVIVLAVIGIVYGSIIAFTQKDGKRLVAYSSIAHVGLIAAGIFGWTTMGLQGAMFQMLSHGINVVGLFFIWDIISSRLNTREVNELGGIAKVAPKFAIAFLIIVLGTVALPLTNGFIGEFMLLNSVFRYNVLLVVSAGSTMIFGAVYMLRMYKKVMQGETNALTAVFADISGSEKLVLGIICALVIIMGIYPQPILHISEAAVNNLVQTVNNKFVQVK